jgi:general secretion pathway protein B
MSLILDALKKLDREKSSRRNRTGNIGVEILRPDRPRPGRRTRMYFTAVSLTAIAAAAITYGMIAGFGSPSKSSPPARVNPPPPSPEVAPPPPSREPVREAREEISQVPPKIQSPAESRAESEASSKGPEISGSPLSPGSAGARPPSQEVAPPPPSREPVREARDEISRVPPKIQSPAEGRAEGKDPATVQGEKNVSRKVIPEAANVAPGNTKKAAENTPKESTANPPSLKLSGILWHEEPLERRAVINGMILSEGSVIEGVKVVEIHPTRVRLSHNGRPFEISINILDR